MVSHRRILLAMVAAFAIGAVSLLPGTSLRPANAQEYNFVVNIDRVYVNSAGGLMVEGTMDCTAAVEAMYGTDPAYQPQLVMANVRWDAYQYIGRTKVVHASYNSGIAHPCWVKGEEGPLPWGTVYPYPSGAPQWVYSKDGKFNATKTLVEAEAVGGWAVWPDPPPSETPGDMYAWNSASLKAVRVK